MANIPVCIDNSDELFRQRTLYLLALVFSIIFWFADAFVDSYFFGEGDFQVLAFYPGSGNVYIRSLVALLFMVFAWQTSRQIRQRDALRNSAEEGLRITASVFENASEAIVVTDLKGNIITVNPAFTSITGYSAEEVIGKNPRILKSGRHDLTFYRNLWDSLINRGQWEGEIWNRRKNGEIVPEWITLASVREPDGRPSRYIGIARDMTTWHDLGKKMAFHAYHDALTGLPNRLLFQDRLQQAIASAHREGKSAGVLYIDLDKFKPVNDTYGHHVGDSLLQAVAAELKKCLRESDSVARLGGDEFAVVAIMENSGERDAHHIAEKIIESLERPFVIEGHDCRISASIGISVFPRNGSEPSELMRKADRAMYTAKEQGGSRIHSFQDQG